MSEAEIPTHDLFGLASRSAIVLGGGDGIGLAVCQLLARVGCNVAIVDFDADRARVAVQEIRGVSAIPFAADVLNTGALDTLFDQADHALGGIDLLVTVVGQAGWSSLVDITPEQWDHDHAKNLRYVVFAAQAFARRLIARGAPGAMTFVSSVSSLQSAPYHAAYGAAKAGMNSLVRSLSVELADHGIRVNAVAPGTIDTPRRRATRDPVQYQEQLRRSGIPLPSPGTTDDVAGAILFLSSALARYVTGQVLSVDGGWTAANLLVREPPPARS